MTQDESLWPQIGPGLDHDWALKQVDTIDELQRITRAGHPGIIVWDAREPADRAGDLSRMQLHCSRFAIVVLDTDTSAEQWRTALQQRQIAALVGIPFEIGQLTEAFASAREDCLTRGIVLGEAAPAAPAAPAASARPAGGRQLPWFKLGLAAAVCLAGTVAFLLHRHAAPRAPVATAAAPLAGAGPAQPVDARASADEQIDALLDKARQAMLDRHFIEPADGNALAMYRSVLQYDPNNGEAREGLQRLAQVLFARVQSDLDARKIDTALQALETARSISPDDPRLANLDARIETLRAELGTAQIQAALNANNFDRALQLLDSAERTKSLSVAKANQLREEIRRLQAQASESDPQAPAQASSKKQHDIDAARDGQARQAKALAHLLELAQARLAQGEILEPENDSALFYASQARASDPKMDGVAKISSAIQSAILAQARAALDSQDTGKTESLLAAARGLGSSADIDTLYDALVQQKLRQSREAAVAAAANSLVPIKPLKLDYPRAALAEGIEGWVDVAFDVTAEGKVTNITIVDASPRNVFDSAAKNALSRERFQPVLVDGQAAQIRATRHIVFRLSKR